MANAASRSQRAPLKNPQRPQTSSKRAKSVPKRLPRAPKISPRWHQQRQHGLPELSMNALMLKMWKRHETPCAPRPWTPLEEAKSTPKVSQKLLWRGQRPQESLKRTSREPFESHWDTFGSRGEARAQKITSPGPGPAIEET